MPSVPAWFKGLLFRPPVGNPPPTISTVQVSLAVPESQTWLLWLDVDLRQPQRGTQACVP